MWVTEETSCLAAELEQNYDPWGRPGAGAPLRTSGGDVLADFNTRKVLLQIVFLLAATMSKVKAVLTFINLVGPICLQTL